MTTFSVKTYNKIFYRLNGMVKKYTDIDSFFNESTSELYRMCLVSGFPKSRIYERSKKMGGKSGFVDRMPDDLKRALLACWLANSPHPES